MAAHQLIHLPAEVLHHILSQLSEHKPSLVNVTSAVFGPSMPMVVGLQDTMMGGIADD